MTLMMAISIYVAGCYALRQLEIFAGEGIAELTKKQEKRKLERIVPIHYWSD